MLTNSKQDLKYFSHKDILEFHKKYYSTALISSNISTISHNTFYRDRNNNIFKLNFLIPKQYFIIYTKIKYILNIYPQLTDNQISYYLKSKFNINITANKVYTVRKRYLIPSSLNRTDKIYLQYEKYYSNMMELTRENLEEYKQVQSVYELISLNEYKYNYKGSRTVYIGSTNNLRKRLTEYIDNYGHTHKIRDFILKNKIYFRFVRSESYRDLEKDVLDAFYETYGNYPLLNRNRVL